MILILKYGGILSVPRSVVRFTVPIKVFLRRILITLISIIVLRFVNFIPITGINQKYLYEELQNSQILSFLSCFSQGSFFVLGPFTLGILPYINSSILVQFLTLKITYLKRLQNEEGKFGRQQLSRIRRYLSFVIALSYGLIISFYLKPFLFDWTFLKAVYLAITLTTGTLVTLWLSDIISEHGVVDGTSLIIFVNISSSLPTFWHIFMSLGTIFAQFFFITLVITGILLILVIKNARRPIPLISAPAINSEFAKVEERTFPATLNPGGIMPLIFSSAVLSVIYPVINQFYSNLKPNLTFNAFYLTIYSLLIVYFSYCSTKILIKPTDIAQFLKQITYNLDDVPIGLATTQFLEDRLNRLATLGGLFLASAVYLPSILLYLNPSLNELQGLGIIPLFILVGVSIDFVNEIQTYKIVGSYGDSVVSKLNTNSRFEKLDNVKEEITKKQ